MNPHESFSNQDPDSQTGGSEWDSLREYSFDPNRTIYEAPHPAETPEQTRARENAERQQRKLIGSIKNQNIRLISAPDVAVTPSDREDVLDMIHEGDITADHFKHIVSQISGLASLLGSKHVYSKMSDDKHERRILAHMSNLGFNKWEETTNDTLERFLEKFPNPADFEEASESFLASIAAYNPEQKFHEYEEAMHSFKHHVYGKKQEYWDQSKALLDEAAQTKVDEPDFSPEPKSEQPYELPEQFHASPEQSHASPERSPAELAEYYLESAEIDGDPYVQDGESYLLQPEHLKVSDLVPTSEISVDGVDIGLSKVFYHGSRPAILGYVKTETGETKVRSYYRSKSSGMWRYLPEYGEEDGWLSKGHGEESLTLPFEMQKKLNEISAAPPADTGNVNPNFYFYGTARHYKDRKEISHQVRQNLLPGDLYTEQLPRPSVEFGKLSLKKDPPETVDVEGFARPDCKKELGSYEMDSETYGKVKVRLFPSYDRSLKYLMCETGTGESRKVWVGGIEKDSPVTSTGCRSEWVAMGDVGTPLYEYTSQADYYGDPSDTKGSYISMWSKYLSKMPLIQRYIKETK